MISLRAKYLNALLRFIKPRRFIKFDNPKRVIKELVPNNIKKMFLVSYQEIKDKFVITIEPKQGSSNRHIIFFHGGAYVLEGSIAHWNLIKKIIQSGSFKVTYIDYPLSPENTYKSTFEMVHEAYDYITGKYNKDVFILMGDSAGGGLALAFAQKLQDEKGKVLPIKNILFSPWLDLSMNNPSIKDMEKIDVILTVTSLKKAGEKYSGGNDINGYLLSPINGDLEGIAPTAVFYGTDELFYPDCLKLKSKAKETNKNFMFFEYQKMQHDWVLFPIPEADKAIEEAINFIGI